MSTKSDQPKNEQEQITDEDKKKEEDKVKSSHHSSRKSRNSSREKQDFIVKIDSSSFTIDPSLNKNLSDFEKICQVGKGSSGRIYKYKNKKTNEIVAVKQGIKNDEDKLFTEQARILSLFHHPTINPLIGIIDNKEEEVKSLITPFYSKGDLSHIQDSKGPKLEGWDFTQKYIVIYGIAVGMAILHKNNFLHRDLKPSSILLSDDLEPIINSLDFSIHIDHDSGYYKPKAIYGTPLFTPIEAFKFDFDDKNAEFNGKRADVYSYAMLCFFVLTGIQPFGNIKNVSTLFSELTKGTRPKFPEGFNPSLQRLIEQCWDEETRGRPSFETIVRALEDKEFIENIPNLDYKRIHKYSKRITPKEFLEGNAEDDLNRSRKHRLSKKASRKHISKLSLVKDKSFFVIKVDRKNITIKPTLYKNISDYTKIGKINDFTDQYRDKSTDEIVLLKKHIISDDDKTLRLRIKIISNLYHPALSQILGVINNLEGKEVKLILPYYEKGNLLNIIENKENSPVGWDSTQKYIVLYGIAVGMAVLHNNNYYHQNLKTASIFLSDQLEPAICNYDATTYVQYDNEDSKPHGLSDIYLFMPPELLSEEDNDDFDGELANVYSYAMICYQLLTGMRPYNNIKSHLSLFSALLSGERPKIPNEVNQSLQELIEQCWAQEPTHRPQFIKILRKLGKQEFIEGIEGLDYKRINKYIINITPDEFIEDSKRQDDPNKIKRHRSSTLSRKSSRKSSRHLGREKIGLTLNVDQDNFAINPSLYKNLSDFEKMEQIGSGSWGSVYKYKDKHTNEIVSIKQGYTDKQNSNYSFYIEEVKILSLFHNPAINTILGIIELKESKEAYIITPFYSNKDLLHFLGSKERSSENWDYTQKYIVLYGIAVGMSILHKNNFLHRDLKPSSILISDQLEPTINNFNSSIHINSDDGNYKPKESFGTLPFIPLEAMNIGSNNTIKINGKKVDVYSYSLLCYQLLTGKQPFESVQDPSQLTEKLSKGERPEIPKDINSELSKIIEKCWNSDPKERPTFDEIVSTLGDQEFIKKDSNLDYKRIRKYQKKVTPKSIIDDIKRKKKKKSTKKEQNDDDNEVLVKIDFSNFSYDPSLNKDLSQYKKFDKIGHGGFGWVFKYQEIGTLNFYAVKKVISDLSDDLNLQREIMISSKLLHPTLQKLCGICINDDSVALFTPYCSNGDLLHMIEEDNLKKAPNEWNETQKYIVMYGIAAGMYILHKNNFIHRDIKPGNILLSDKLEPLITDFGCSKMVDQNNLMYQTGMVGTMQFMAPEILLSEDLEYDGKMADVYAYAILCYQLLTGIRPFENVRKIDMYNLMSNEVRPDFPDEFNPSLKDFVENCWKQNPEERFSFEEILNVLGDRSFIEKSGNIDIDKLKEYQKKVVGKKFRKL